ncbi:unnamed protein product, partial [Mesorhabditis belari]|uniref:PAN-3 domain-containing protein n=1 Tax=Mesorhabditis belari TaxID=2138241 RepID=A0AAF3EK61_9BILA
MMISRDGSPVLPSTPGECVPADPPMTLPITYYWEHQYQYRDGQALYQTHLKTLKDCHNNCVQNLTCGTYYWSATNTSCVWYKTTEIYKNQMQSHSSSEVIFSRRYYPLTTSRFNYVTRNPYTYIYQNLAGTGQSQWQYSYNQ